MIDELSSTVPEHLAESIRASLLRIHAKKLNGAELAVCLDEAYDVFATTFFKRDFENFAFYRFLFPSWVLRWAVERQWFSPPPLLLEPGMELIRPGKWVAFGDLRVRETTELDILKRLESRIAYWEAEIADFRPFGYRIAAAEAAQRIPAELPSEDHQSVVAFESSHRALIDGFIERVYNETATRIKKADIWRVAGYQEPSEFNRFQRNDPKASAKGTNRFKKILGMGSRDFLKLHQRLPRNEE